MNFLNPSMIAAAAAVTIPPLIALYFLKLKRSVKIVPSTLLWKRSVEDLQVNSPFQRLRRSLLLLLQLLVLIAAVIALGKPMLQTAERAESTVIILIDKSASMAVVEADGRTRLETAKAQAKRAVRGLSDDARVMVIAFCDRAAMVSSFDSDKDAVIGKIDAIEQTDSRSSLSEAIGLAEAYAQNITIGTTEAGSEIAPESAAPPATVFLFTDGRVEDADKVAMQRLDVEKIRLTSIGTRDDNVGIMTMAARRNYERPDVLDVVATVRNFGERPVAFDATLVVDGIDADVQPVRLEPRGTAGAGGGDVHVIAFDPVVFGGGGPVEVWLRIDDALAADNRAWTVIEPPRRVRVLLVTDSGIFLENALSTLSVELSKMTGATYETIDDELLTAGKRSAFDVVVFDRHSTARLPSGDYLFWASVPQVNGVSVGRTIGDEMIFDWDETHPVLRHVSVDSLEVSQWLELELPPDAQQIIEGQSSPILGYFARDASRYLVCAFSPITENDRGEWVMNTYWVTSPEFVVFIQNAVEYLSSNVAAVGARSVSPGDPVTVVLEDHKGSVGVTRPDGQKDEVSIGSASMLHYEQTRQVGLYHLDAGDPGNDLFAVNLFNPIESNVRPTSTLTLSAQPIEARAGQVETNEPAWPYFLVAMLVLLLVEWVIYNQRVFV